MAEKTRFDWVDEDEPDGGLLSPPEDMNLPADYDPTDKFSWEMDDISMTDPQAVNDWTGILKAGGEDDDDGDSTDAE